MNNEEIDINRFCKYCGAKMVLVDTKEPEEIGFDDFTGTKKYSYKEYLGACPNKKGVLAYRHDMEWYCFDGYTNTYYYAGLYNTREAPSFIIVFGISTIVFIIVALISTAFNII